MIKGMIIRRVFNWIMIILLIAAFSGAVYFYISVKSNVNTLDASVALINDILSERGILDSVMAAISNLNSLAMIQIATFLITIVSLLFLLWFVFRLYAIVELKALIDPLTELYNRRAIMLGLKKEIERAERFGHSTSIAILDIDYFKSYNDNHGHKEGDKALTKVARTLDKTIRKTDMVGRIGGEEFLLIFPETNRMKAIGICERIRQNIEDRKFDFEADMPKHKLTVSIGVAEFKDSKFKHKADVFEQADKQLYIAKMSGRNAVR
jgi:diguanylate cyclase (GGDEF)-like protein